MFKTFFPATLFLLVLTVPSCKIGQVANEFAIIKKDAQQISKDIKAVRGAIVPIDSMMMEVTSGVLTGLSKEESEVQLDTIAARISRILTAYLNASFKNLDPGPMARNLTAGAIDPILSAQTEERLRVMISAVSRQAGRDLSVAVRQVMDEMSSPVNKAKLNSLVLSLFTTNAADSLSSFLNRSMQEIDFEAIGENLSEQLLSAQVRPQVDTIVRSAVRAIFDEIRKDDTAKGFFTDIRNVLFLALGVLGVIMAIMFWLNRRKAMDLNRMFVHAIEDLEGRTRLEVKEEIARQARHHGLTKNLDNVLEKHSLLKRKETKT